MMVTVYNERGQSIRATLISLDAAGQELQRDAIPVGGVEYARPGEAMHWVFIAPGYQDANRNDLLNYDNFSEQLIPKYKWVVPVILGLSAYWLLSKTIKF
jgi:hypothetical protein